MSTASVAVPIAELHPELAEADRCYLQGVVTLVWPYSSSSKSLSLLLVEPDFRLRARHGQVRLYFNGASAKAVSKRAVTSGDQLTLSLRGVTWVKDGSTASTPGKGIEWQLQYGEYLDLRIRQESGTTTSISVDHPAPSPDPSDSPYDLPPYNSHIPTSSRKHPQDYLKQLQTWESPAFLKRGRFLASAYDPFAEDADFPDNDRRKRTKFGYGSGQWRFTEKTPSPVKETAHSGSRADQETPSRPPQYNPAPFAVPFSLGDSDSIVPDRADVQEESTAPVNDLSPVNHQDSTPRFPEETIAALFEDDKAQPAHESPGKSSTEPFKEPSIPPTLEDSAQAVTQPSNEPLQDSPEEPIPTSVERSDLQAAPQPLHKLSSEAPVQPITATVEGSIMQATIQPLHKPSSEAPEEPKSALMEESDLHVTLQPLHKLSSEAPEEPITATVEGSSMQATPQPLHKLSSEAPEEPTTAIVEGSNMQATPQPLHKPSSEAPEEPISAPMEESDMQVTLQPLHKPSSEAPEEPISAPMEESDIQVTPQPLHKLSSEAPEDPISAPVEVEESDMQVMPQPLHKLSSEAPEEPISAPVEGSSVQAATQSPHKLSSEAQEEPNATPVEETSMQAASQSPHKLSSETPEEPIVISKEGGGGQAALQSPHTPLLEHSKEFTVTPVESDTGQSVLETSHVVSSEPFEEPDSVPSENERSTEEKAIQASVDLDTLKHSNEDLDVLDAPFTVPVIPSSQQQDGAPSPSTNTSQGEMQMVQDSSPKSVISIGSSPSPSISSSEQSGEPNQRVGYELREDRFEPTNEVAFQLDEFGRTTTTDEPPNFGFDGSMFSKLNSRPHDIPIDPELANLSASKDDYQNEAVASSGPDEYMDFLNRVSEAESDIGNTRMTDRSSVHSASLQGSPQSSQGSEAIGSSVASSNSSQRAVTVTNTDHHINSATPGAVLTDRPWQIGQTSPPPELAPAPNGDVNGPKSNRPEEADLERPKNEALKLSQVQIIDLESEEDDEAETTLAPQVHQSESKAHDTRQQSQASPSNISDLVQPLRDGTPYSEGAPEEAYSDRLADDNYDMSIFSGGNEAIVRHSSFNSDSKPPNDESPKAAEDSCIMAQPNDQVTEEVLNPPSIDPQASVASAEAQEQAGKLSLPSDTPVRKLDELPSTVPDSAAVPSSDQLLTPEETQKRSFVSQPSTLSLRSFEDQDTLPTPGLTQGTSAGIELPRTPTALDEDSLKTPRKPSTEREFLPPQEHAPTDLSVGPPQSIDQFREHKATLFQALRSTKPSVSPPLSSEGLGEEQVSIPRNLTSNKHSISPPRQAEKMAEPEAPTEHKLVLEKLYISPPSPDEKPGQQKAFRLQEPVSTSSSISPPQPSRRSARHQASATPEPTLNKVSVSPHQSTKQSPERKPSPTHELEPHPANSSPPPFSPITPLKRRSALVEKLRARRLASENTPKSRIGNTSRTASPWFAPRRSNQVVPDSDADSVLSETEKESMDRTPKKPHSLLATPEKSLAQSFVRSSPAGSVASSQYVPPSQPTFGGLRTSLSYFVPLDALPQHFGTLTDTFAVAINSTPVTRAKSGPRDFTMTLYIADYSLSKSKHPVVMAQLFRPDQRALPQIKPGNAIMLRNFKVQSFQHQISLLSTDASAWVVFSEGTEPQVRGPPIEFGAEERAFARGHWKWWASLTEFERGMLLTAMPKETPVKANGKTNTKTAAIDGIGVDLPGSQTSKGGKKRDQLSTQALAQEWGLDGTVDGESSDDKPVTRRRGLRPRKGRGKTASKSPEKKDPSPRTIKNRSKSDSGSDKDELKSEIKGEIRMHELRDGRRYNDRR